MKHTDRPTSYFAHVAVLVAALLISAFSAHAQPAGKKHHSIKGNFEDVLQDLQDAVINRGLVIDYVGHIDKMLVRTSKAAGSKSPYLNAKYMHFCSARLTHEAVSADVFNLAICPYVIFIFEARAEPGKIVVGYRAPVPGPSKRSQIALAKIEKLLDDIAKEATSE